MFRFEIHCFYFCFAHFQVRVVQKILRVEFVGSRCWIPGTRDSGKVGVRVAFVIPAGLISWVLTTPLEFENFEADLFVSSLAASLGESLVHGAVGVRDEEKKTSSEMKEEILVVNWDSRKRKRNQNEDPEKRFRSILVGYF